MRDGKGHDVTNRRSDSSSLGLLSDGCERAWLAIEPRVRREVEAEFAEELQQASGWLQRWRLWQKMESEIYSRLSELAPPDALY